VGKFDPVQEKHVGLAMETAEEACGETTMNSRGLAPEHLVYLYGDSCDGCESNKERQVVAQLLSKYKNVFSRGDHDLGCLS